MSDYAAALSRYLSTDGTNQEGLAEKVGTTQASISRYKGSDTRPPRLPSRDLALKIDEATGGQVPFALWIAEAAKQIGLAA